MSYSQNTAGTTIDAILSAVSDLAAGEDHSPYVGNSSGTTLDGILQAFSDLVTGSDNRPYARNTSGTTLDGILDALTDLVAGNDSTPYVRNTDGSATLDGILDALTDLVKGEDNRPYSVNTFGTTWNGVLEALTDLVDAGGIGDVSTSAITLTDIPAHHLFQRDIGEEFATITLAGTYTGGAPASIEAEFRAVSDSDLWLAHTALSNFSAAGGTWSGDVEVPQTVAGDPIKVANVRVAADPGVSAAGSNPFHIGIVLAGFGQSNWGNHLSTTSSPPAAAPGALYFNGTAWTTSVPAGNGVRNLLNDLVAALGIPVGLVTNHQDGVPSNRFTPGYNGLNDADAFETLAARLTASGGDAEFLIVHQGEGNAATGETARWDDDWDTIHGALATLCGRTRAQMPMIVSGLATWTASPPSAANFLSQQNVMLNAESTLTGVLYSHSNMDAALSDGLHWTAASYGRSGKRYAQTILYALGEVSTRPRFAITAAERVDDETLRLTVAHSMGTDFAAAVSEWTGFELSDDSFATTLTITDVAREDATHILITHETVDTAEDIEVRYQYGPGADVSDPVRDNGGLNAPVMFTSAPLLAEGIAAPSTLAYTALGALTMSSTGTSVQSTTGGVGSAAAGRRILLLFGYPGSTEVVSSLTFTPSDGASAGVPVAFSSLYSPGGSDPRCWAFLSDVLPSDCTTGAWTLTFTTAVFNGTYFYRWIIDDASLVSLTPVDADTDRVASGTQVSVDISVAAGGAVFAFATSRDFASNPASWADSEVGMSERADAAHSGAKHSAADMPTTADETDTFHVEVDFAKSVATRLIAVALR